MKLRSLLLIIVISTFSTSAKSFYTAESAPMIKMMTLMMEMMTRLMLGGGSSSMGSGFGSLPSSTMPYSMLPMSPLLSQGAMSGMNPLSNYSQFNPFLQAQQAKQLENKLLANNSNVLKNKSTSMNGIWQALSGDIMAIYHDTNFIWSDGKTRHLVGKLAIKNDKLTVVLSASQKIVTFKFYRENNQFAVKDKSGQMFVFKRIY